MAKKKFFGPKSLAALCDIIKNGFVTKEDGKGLSTNDYTTTDKDKLGKIEDGANYYVHPDTHPATMIQTDTSRQFVDASEKSTWNDKLSSTGNASNVTTAFTQATSRSNLTTGEKLSVSLGKLMKWFADLKSVAFTGKASDVTADSTHRFVSDTEKSTWNAKIDKSSIIQNATTTDTTKVVSAAVAKALQDQITEQNTNLTKIINSSDGTGLNYVVANFKLFGNGTKLCHVNTNFRGAMSKGTAYTSTNLIPTAYRPKFVVVNSFISATGVIFYFELHPTGEAKITPITGNLTTSDRMTDNVYYI